MLSHADDDLDGVDHGGGGGGPSRPPISKLLDNCRLIHTRHPNLISSLCLPGDEGLTFDQLKAAISDRLTAKLAQIEARRQEARRQEAQRQVLADHGCAQELGESSSGEVNLDHKLYPCLEMCH